MEIAIRAEHQILRLNITMDGFVVVEVIKSDHNIGNEELSLVFRELPELAKMVSQISPINVVHDQIQILPILKCA